MKHCPRCDEPWDGVECQCGHRPRDAKPYVDPQHGKCAWLSGGCRCQLPGTISPGTGEPNGTTSGQGSRAKWYCGWHFECLMKGLRDDFNTPEYAAWYQREASYTRQHARKPPIADGFADAWIPGDIHQIKGLAMMGPGSLAWRKSPTAMQRQAQDYLDGHGVPKIGLEWPQPPTESDLEAEKRRMIEDFNRVARDRKTAAAGDEGGQDEQSF